MKRFDTSLVCIEIASLAIGYKALNALTNGTDLRVLDASPAGSRFVILATGQVDVLQDALRRTRAAIDGAETEIWVDFEIIENIDQGLMEAVFALPQEPIAESLVVVECPSVCGCLASAQTLVHGHGLKAIELRVKRSGEGGAYGFFTGEALNSLAAAEDARTKLRAAVREGRIEVVEQPTQTFREFFNLSGES